MNGRIKPSVHAYLSMIILILLISFAIFLWNICLTFSSSDA
jgi:hypothetical protein